MSTRSPFSHLVTTGMAVGATLIGAGLLAPPASALGDLSVNPARVTAGTSPGYTLQWMRTSSVGGTILIALSGLDTTSGADCGSLGITVSVGGTRDVDYDCAFSGGTYTLSRVRNVGSPVQVTFPEHLILAPSTGTGTFTVRESLLAAGVSVNVEIVEGSSTSPIAGLGDQVPPDWMRQYQRMSQEEECLPQWNPSYAMWANAGTGGWVCVQTDHWDTSLGRWTLR